jgi:hypothetical protein
MKSGSCKFLLYNATSLSNETLQILELLNYLFSALEAQKKYIKFVAMFES